MKNKQIVILTALAIIVGATSFGCATHPNKIAAQYVSPLVYKDYTEEQIIAEMNFVGQRTNELHHRLRKTANNDKLQTAAGLVLFWPVLFALEGGDGPEATEYARLKGTYEALRQVAIQKNINLYSLPPSPESIIEKEKERLRNLKKSGPNTGIQSRPGVSPQSSASPSSPAPVTGNKSVRKQVFIPSYHPSN